MNRVCLLLYVVLSIAIAVGTVVWYFHQDFNQQFKNIPILILGVYFGVAWACICLYRYSCKRQRANEDNVIQKHIRVWMLTPRKSKWFPGSYGDSLDLLILAISLLSCVMYVAETYVPSATTLSWWIGLEVVISLALMMDYALRMFISLDSLAYLFSVAGIINIVTSMPLLLYGMLRLTLFQSEDAIRVNYLRLLRLMKLMRVMRAMNLMRSESNDSLRQELFTLFFSICCLIFSAAGVYQWLENDEACWDVSAENTFLGGGSPGGFIQTGCIHFHLAWYWITIEVLGRPRLDMERNSTVIMLNILVFLSALLIPRHVARVISVMQATTKHQRKKYTRSSAFSRHLVIVGHREFASINMLLYEFFHPDRGDHSLRDVVLLFPSEPGRDIEWLLAHPAYVGRVTYLQGSILLEKDMERAGLKTAAAVVVLANKDAEDPKWHDSELLTCIQAMKAFWLKEIVQQSRLPLQQTHAWGSRDIAQSMLRPRIITQMLLSETKDYLVELPGWTDRDVVVVCSEFLALMVAMALLARGMATLVFNLISHTEKQKFYQTKWYPRYEAGACQEIYSTRLRTRHTLIGASMTEACSTLAGKNCILLAVERVYDPTYDDDRHQVHHRGLHIYPGPPEFTFRSGDRMLCVTENYRSMINILDTAKRPTRLTGAVLVDRIRTFAMERLGGQYDQQVEEMVEQSECAITREDSSISFKSTTKHVPRGCEDVLGMSERNEDVVAMHMYSLTHGGNPVCHRAMSSIMTTDHSLPMVEVVEMLSKIEPPWKDHIVFCGLSQTQVGRSGGRGLVSELIETLQAAHGIALSSFEEMRVCIVDNEVLDIVANLCLIEPCLMSMCANGCLRAINGNPRHRVTLITKAYIGHARAVISMPEPVGRASRREMSTVEVRDGKFTQRMLKQIVDMNTVLTTQVARGCADRARLAMSQNLALVREVGSEGKLRATLEGRLHCVTLLLQESTANLFFGHANMRHAGSATSSDPRWLDITPLNMSPLFATGELVAQTCFDRFVAEALFTPQVVELTHKLLFGDATGNRLAQIHCPNAYVGEFYEVAVLDLTEQAMVPLGLLRLPIKGCSISMEELGSGENAELPDATLPYVIANPPPKTIILQSSDTLYVVGNCDDIAALRLREKTGPQESKASETADSINTSSSWVSAEGAPSPNSSKPRLTSRDSGVCPDATEKETSNKSQQRPHWSIYEGDYSVDRVGGLRPDFAQQSCRACVVQ